MMPETSITAATSASAVRRSRRTHRKSRSGCENCKLRRIKCDEKKPVCTNCANHEVECTFSKSRGPGSVDTRPAPRRYRFRSYQYLPGGQRLMAKSSSPIENSKPLQTSIESASAEGDATATATTTTTTSTTSTTTISMADLELFHHFTVNVYRTLAEPDMQGVWQNDITKWGFEFPSILYLILALSALHLSHERRALRNRYVQEADRYFTFGVQSVTAVISELDVDRCQKVYIAAVLICFVYFGRGPRPGEYLIFSDSGPAEWIVLMHGVKLILQSYQEKVFSGILKPKTGPAVLELSPSLLRELQEHKMHVQNLQQLIDCEITDETDRVMYISVTVDLINTLDKLFAGLSVHKLRVGSMQTIMGWIYRLPAEFVKRLEQKEPFSLVVLAHWAMLLRYMREVWFMKGWDEHILSGIRSFLPVTLQQWIEWPLLAEEQVGRMQMRC